MWLKSYTSSITDLDHLTTTLSILKLSNEHRKCLTFQPLCEVNNFPQVKCVLVVFVCGYFYLQMKSYFYTCCFCRDIDGQLYKARELSPKQRYYKIMKMENSQVSSRLIKSPTKQNLKLSQLENMKWFHFQAFHSSFGALKCAKHTVIIHKDFQLLARTHVLQSQLA